MKFFAFVLTSFIALSVQAQDVHLYSRADFKGRSLSIRGDVGDMNITRLRHVKSIDIPWGYKVELFSQPHFRGTRVATLHSVANMKYTRLHQAGLGSIRLTWLGRDWPDLPVDTTEGITVFSKPGYRGDYQVFQEDSIHLGKTLFGNDRACSVLVPPGFSTILYRAKRFGGRAYRLDNSVPDLSQVRGLGCGTTSSLQVFWPGDAAPVVHHPRPPVRVDVPPPPIGIHVDVVDDDLDDVVAVAAGAILIAGITKAVVDHQDSIRLPGPGITLFGKSDFHGRRLDVHRRYIKNLKYHGFNDCAKSIEIPPGYEVTLYEHKRFKGRSVTLSRSVANLDQVRFGNNRASSLKVAVAR